MNPREKMLAGLVALSLLALVASMGMQRVSSLFASRERTIEQLQKDLREMRAVRSRAKQARLELTEYERRSMPSDAVLASSRYRAWLHDWAEQAGITQENVEYLSGRRKGDDYNVFTFSVTCEGDLHQLVKLLHSFYSNDYMHRIKHLVARPQKDKKLALAFTIETLSLPTAPADRQLAPLPSERLAFADVEDYFKVIVNRNPYAPANEPPRFVSTGPVRGYVAERIQIRARAEDPERQGVRYKLGPVDLPGLEIDEQSGTITWTPEKPGEYEIPVYAIDEGLPPKQTATTIRVEVSPPPPPEKPDAGPPPFDPARFAVPTAFVEVNGRPEVWITSRTEGEVLKLHEGDSFRIGRFEGTIERITPRHVEVRSGGQRLVIRYGQSLREGRPATP